MQNKSGANYSEQKLDQVGPGTGGIFLGSSTREQLTAEKTRKLTEYNGYQNVYVVKSRTKLKHNLITLLFKEFLGEIDPTSAAPTTNQISLLLSATKPSNSTISHEYYTKTQNISLHTEYETNCKMFYILDQSFIKIM